MQINRVQLTNSYRPNFSAKPSIKKTQTSISLEEAKKLIKSVSEKSKEKFEPIGIFANINTPAYRKVALPSEDCLLNLTKK